MKDWEIIADNLSKAGWSWGCSQRSIPRANDLDCRHTSRRRSILLPILALVAGIMILLGKGLPGSLSAEPCAMTR